MRYIRRANKTDFTDDYVFTATIDMIDYPVTVTGIAAPPEEALEIELDDGSVYVVLAYQRK